MTSKLLALALVGTLVSFTNADIMLTVMGGENPNGTAPENGGTQWLLGLTFTDNGNGPVHAEDMKIAGALHDVSSAASGSQSVMFESELVNLEPTEDAFDEPDRYFRHNDSYWAEPWANGGGTLFPPMGADTLVYDSFGTYLTGPTTVPLAYVNVPDGGEVLIFGNVTRGTDQIHLPPDEYAALVEQLSVGGDLQYSLSANGVLTNVNAIPEPSSFLLLGLLGTGAVIWRVRRPRR